jgi:diguanylate cyclase (GGDEF)-like protein
VAPDPAADRGTFERHLDDFAMDELKIARAIVDGLADPAVLLDSNLSALGYNARFLDLVGLRRRAFEARLAEVASPLELVATNATALEREHAQICLRTRKPITLAEVAAKNGAGDAITMQITLIPVLNQAGEPVAMIESLRDVSAEARVQSRYHELLAVERLRAEHLEREVEKRTRELTSALEQVTRLSREDPLTGLLNRRAFTEHAELAMKMARRHHRSVGILVCDLDFFKKVNDTYGHQAGDAVLVEIAKLLRRVFRDTDVIARFGGEEFVVLLSETAGEGVAVIGERLREAVERHGKSEPLPGVRFPTMSIGMSVFPEHGDSLDVLVSRADEALYQAKEGGRNRALLHDPRRQKPPAGAPVRAEIRPRVLAIGPPNAEFLVGALSGSYEVVMADSAEALLEMCRRERFDVLVCDVPDVDGGIDLLRRSLRLRPEALRVLVIDTEDVFLEVRGANIARVDCFLLRREGPSNIVAAIDAALSRRELDRQRMMLDNDEVRRLYTSRLNELDELIDEKQLGVAFQPIVDPRSGALFAYEALARAKHPLFKNATLLFEAAVQSGNLWRLGRLCREIAMATAPEVPSGGKLFLNLHPGEIDDPELVTWGAQQGGSDKIVLEITERAAIPDFRRFRNTARALAARGFQFAIDDLGAGYASLNAVALLEPGFVKIDMTMVRGIDTSTHKQRLIRRMVDFSNDVGIKLVAEGVETAGEARSVGELGCHFAQGFFFGKPEER